MVKKLDALERKHGIFSSQNVNPMNDTIAISSDEEIDLSLTIEDFIRILDEEDTCISCWELLLYSIFKVVYIYSENTFFLAGGSNDFGGQKENHDREKNEAN